MDKGKTAGMNRREFVQTVSRWIGWGGLAVLVGGSAIEAIKFFIPNIIYEPPKDFIAGKPDEYPLGVNEKWKDKHRLWLVRNDKGFYTFYAKCTYTRCNGTPNWFEVEQKFKCPCCGSNFNIVGDVVYEPAREPLYRYGISLTWDSQLFVDMRFKENRPEFRDKPPFFLALKYF